MQASYTYLLILAGSLAGPLLLSFDRKVAYYRKWKYLFPAMLLPALFFLVWDELKTRAGVWSFSAQHIIGTRIGSLPLEEVLFFFVVPYCCVFIYECIVCYFPGAKGRRWGWPVLAGLMLLFAVAAAGTVGKAYTFYTAFFNALFLLLLLLFRSRLKGFDPAAFLISYVVIVLPFLLVNGLLTGIPVVLYNDAENLGFRIFSFLPWPMQNIPIEDTFYGMLLILMNVVGFEWLRNRKA